MTSEDSPPSSSSSPPTTKRRRLRKEEIVAEATRLFAERGYEGTSMGDLAESVGLRKASLFHHFESKDSLYATVLGQLLDSVRSALAGAVISEGSFAQRLDTLVDSVTGIFGAQPHAARLLFREAMDWGPIMRDKLGGRIQKLLAGAEEFVKAGQREGIFNAALEPKQLLITLIGVMMTPFLIDRTVEQFTGESPFGRTFVEDRQRAVREQIRAMMLACPQKV